MLDYLLATYKKPLVFLLNGIVMGGGAGLSMNGMFRIVTENTASSATDASCESAVTTPQHSMRDANNPAGLLSIAEDTLAEFLSKATGTAVDWVQMPGMKPGPDSVGIFAISHSCSGVAARACGLVSLEPTKIAEILKDRPSWFRDCRSLEVFTMFRAGNGGTIELIYTQIYAPTTLAPARDLWTLRYSLTLENGSLVCRQKTRDFVASCKNQNNGKPCTMNFCHKCLLNRLDVFISS